MEFDLIKKKYSNNTWNKLNALNTDHVKNTSIVLLCLTMFLFVIDYSNIKRGFWISNPAYQELFLAHILISVVCFFFVVSYYGYKDKIQSNESYFKLNARIFLVLILNIAAFISGKIDQNIHGQITVYIFVCFYFSFFVYQKPVYTLVTYFQSYAFLVFLLFLSQPDPEVRIGHIGNSFIVVVLACLIQIKVSEFMHNYHIYKLNLENIVDEKTKELKQSLEQVQKLDRLNIAEEMAVTVAHEIRNPLTTIRGFLQLLRQKQSDQVEYFDLMISEIDRTNDIITELLSISRTKLTIMNAGNLARSVKNLLPLIEADATNREMYLRSNINSVADTHFNEQEILQLVLNLSRNGLEAMDKGGVLTINVYEENDEIILSVQDQGEGIPQHIMDQLGTPFFTTKDMGTGLGLVICNSIIERHKGKLNIMTSSKGTLFNVHFGKTA